MAANSAQSTTALDRITAIITLADLSLQWYEFRAPFALGVSFQPIDSLYHYRVTQELQNIILEHVWRSYVLMLLQTAPLQILYAQNI